MKPSWRDWTSPEVCFPSSLCASGTEEAAKTLKESIFGFEMRKDEDFLTVWKKEEDGHENPSMVSLSGEEEKLWEWEFWKGWNFGLVMWFERCKVEEEGET